MPLHAQLCIQRHDIGGLSGSIYATEISEHCKSALPTPQTILNISMHTGPRDNHIWQFALCFRQGDPLRVLGCCLKEEAEEVLGKVRAGGALPIATAPN